MIRGSWLPFAASLGLAHLSLAAAVTPPVDRKYEGNWYVADSTDNNTGEREVYAFRTHLEAYDPDYVTLTLRCSDSKPTFFVDWDKLSLPEQAVIGIGASSDPDAELDETKFVFEKSKSVVESGYRASPEDSARIISLIGDSDYAVVTVHATYGAKTMGFEVVGTPKAWDRVVRHCPAPIMPLPPL